MTDPKTLARLKELEAKATLAPWEACPPDGAYYDVIRVYPQDVKNQHVPVAIYPQRTSPIMQVLGGETNETTEAACNASLSVALRNAARSLISDAESLAAAEDRVKELDAEVERLRPFEPRVLPSDWPHECKIAHAKGFMEPLVLAFDAMNGECNYTETCVRHGSKEYTVTVRRGDKPTPHELRMAAEARVRELEEALLAEEAATWWRETGMNMTGPDCKTPIADSNPIARDAVVQKEVGGC